MAFAVCRPTAVWRRGAILALVALLLLASLVNVAQFYVLLARGQIQSGFPIPFSLFVSAALALLVPALWTQPASDFTRRQRRLGWFAGGVTLGACLVGFPLAQMFCFGLTDYRRPADVIVVLGAKAYADGAPSHALEERVRTGWDVYTVPARRIHFMPGLPRYMLREVAALWVYYLRPLVEV